jgi:hypothetical protein
MTCAPCRAAAACVAESALLVTTRTSWLMPSRAKSAFNCGNRTSSALPSRRAGTSTVRSSGVAADAPPDAEGSVSSALDGAAGSVVEGVMSDLIIE